MKWVFDALFVEELIDEVIAFCCKVKLVHHCDHDQCQVYIDVIVAKVAYAANPVL